MEKKNSWKIYDCLVAHTELSLLYQAKKAKA